MEALSSEGIEEESNFIWVETMLECEVGKARK